MNHMNEIPRRSVQPPPDSAAAEFLLSARVPSRLPFQGGANERGAALETITKKGEFLPSKAEEVFRLKRFGRSSEKNVPDLSSVAEKKSKAEALSAMLSLDGGGGGSSSRHDPAVEAAAALTSPAAASLSAFPCIDNNNTDVAAFAAKSGDTYAYKDYAKLVVDAPPSGSIPQQSFASSTSAAGPDPDPAGGAIGFPERLYDLLSHPHHASDISDVIAWRDHGRSWTILKPKEFERTVLPRFYSAKCKYTSFIRQANGWGFRRITQGQDRNSYYHELFLRGMPHLINLMRRPGVSKKLPSDPENEPDFYKISKESPLPPLPHQVPAKDASASLPAPVPALASALPAVVAMNSSSNHAASLAGAGGQPSMAMAELLRSNQLCHQSVAIGEQRQQAMLSKVIRSARANQEITALLQSNLHCSGIVRAQQQHLRRLQLSVVLRGGASAGAGSGSPAAANLLGAATPLRGGDALTLEAAQRRRADALRQLSEGGGIDRRASRVLPDAVFHPPGTIAVRRHSEAAAVNRRAAMMTASLETGAVRALNNTGPVRALGRRYSETPNLAMMSAAAAVVREEEEAEIGGRAYKLRRLSENGLDRRAIAAGETALRRRSSLGADQFAANAAAVALGVSRNSSASSVASLYYPPHVSTPPVTAALSEVTRERGFPSVPGAVHTPEPNTDLHNVNVSAIERRIQNLHSQLHQAMQERQAAAAAATRGGASAVMAPVRGRRAARRVSFQDRSVGSAASAAAPAIGSLTRSHSNQSTEF